MSGYWQRNVARLHFRRQVGVFASSDIIVLPGSPPRRTQFRDVADQTLQARIIWLDLSRYLGLHGDELIRDRRPGVIREFRPCKHIYAVTED